MQAVALMVVAAAGLWLIGVAFLMALRPGYCLRLFEKMSANLERSNWRLQFTEQGLRVLAGAALIVRAPASKLPLVFEFAGWLLVLTSLLIMVAPIRWHGAYGRWLIGRIGPQAIRVLSPAPMMAGAGLIYAAF
ncbi:MAG TPA: hypothetical protein VND65_19015 [Candidatus Binatia bacterium]|nr:hypothetical protein [Candidatus Binatia bacterium]